MLMTTKFKADTKRIIEKMETLADETAAYIPEEDEWEVRADAGGR